MKKIFVAVVLSVLFVAQTALAMTFQPPVKIGRIGFPVQAPYHGLIVDGATSNDGTLYRESTPYRDKQGYITSITTYTKGTARFGDGANALWCRYNFEQKNSADCFIKFGGANDFVLTQNITDKEIFQIDNDADLALYASYHIYCVTDLKILGKRGDKWVVYLDSKKLSEKYFGGKDGYKLDGGVLYDVPTCAGDTIVVTWRRWHWYNNGGISEPEGEFRFKWDDAAQWFAVEQIIY